jgi:quercetin dioxygenase-like cupin family protein
MEALDAHSARALAVPDPTAVLLAGAETGGRCALVERIEVRGAEPPCHLHRREDETLYVLEGALRVRLAGSWRDVPAGTAIFLPRDVEHAIAVVTARARVLSILTPAGFEGFYHELGAAEPGVERLIATAARYGCEITGPPPARRVGHAMGER